MFYVTPDNIGQKRTIRPIYAQHQATPHAGFLDPNWNRLTDIYPGMVMSLNGPEQFTLYTDPGGTSTQKPYGLAALWVAPKLGIDEVRWTGTNLYTVWIGGADAFFEILAPAFDPNGNWTVPTDGSRKLLGVTQSTHAVSPGLLSPISGTNVGASPIAELIAAPSTTKILVRLNRFA